jgi:hypothetical protein
VTQYVGMAAWENRQYPAFFAVSHDRPVCGLHGVGVGHATMAGERHGFPYVKPGLIKKTNSRPKLQLLTTRQEKFLEYRVV